MKTRNYLEEALKIRDFNYGEEHESVADTLQLMGNVYREWNDLDEAMAYFEEALWVKRLALLGGEDKHHEEVANGLHNMGILYDDLQEYDRSIECYRETLYIRIMLFDGINEREEVADTWQCMGNVYLADQESEDALHSF